VKVRVFGFIDWLQAGRVESSAPAWHLPDLGKETDWYQDGRYSGVGVKPGNIRDFARNVR
jgi:hypothetical protein